MRCDPNKNLNLDALVGRLTTFEIDSHDKYVSVSKNIVSLFEKLCDASNFTKEIKDKLAKIDENLKNSDS